MNRRTLERVLYGAEKSFQIHAGKRPATFYPLYSVLRGNSSQAVCPTTEVVIEGFPRSANSFAVVAFRQAQNRKVSIANNLHVPAQIVRAARWKVPALLLIRDPRDAVPSLAVRDPISISQALKYYVSFYETVEGYAGSFVLAPFEEVTSDYGAVINRLNEGFSTSFSPFRHTKKNVTKVFTRIEEVYERSFTGRSPIEDAVSRPSAARAEKKEDLRRELSAPKHGKLLRQARAVYERITGG